MTNRRPMQLKNPSGFPDPAANSRQQILQRLLENKQGLSINELSMQLNISRTAVQNHFLILEKQGLIRKQNRLKTMGRPLASYVLTDKGTAYFPKQYALLSLALLQELRNEMTPDQLNAYLQRLGKTFASHFLTRFEGRTEDRRIETLFELMQEMGYHAQLHWDKNETTAEISVFNCIYHGIAKQFQEICTLDIGMMENLVKNQVELRSCMAKGGNACCLHMTFGNGQQIA